MKKASLCLALCAAFSLVVVTSPSYAASKKAPAKSKAKVSVTVRKHAPAAPPMVANFNSCVASGVGVLPVLSAVGCTAVWAVPVWIEALFFPRA